MKFVLIKFVLMIPFLTFGQENNVKTEIKRNSIYVEALGQGLFNSLTFDRLYNIDKKIKTSFSIGLTSIPLRKLFVLATPLSYNYIFGKKNCLELGFGLTPMYLREGTVRGEESYIDENGTKQIHDFIGYRNNLYSFFTPKVGYRFQKPNGGIFMRLTFTPPIAGINRVDLHARGGKYNPTNGKPMIEYFSNAAFFDYPIVPWGGFSIGWTMKK